MGHLLLESSHVEWLKLGNNCFRNRWVNSSCSLSNLICWAEKTWDPKRICIKSNRYFSRINFWLDQQDCSWRSVFPSLVSFPCVLIKSTEDAWRDACLISYCVQLCNDFRKGCSHVSALMAPQRLLLVLQSSLFGAAIRALGDQKKVLGQGTVRWRRRKISNQVNELHGKKILFSTANNNQSNDWNVWHETFHITLFNFTLFPLQIAHLCQSLCPVKPLFLKQLWMACHILGKGAETHPPEQIQHEFAKQSGSCAVYWGGGVLLILGFGIA